MKTTTQEIKNKVHMENQLRTVYNAVLPMAQETIRPFLNQAVTNQGDDIKKKIKDLFNFDLVNLKSLINPLYHGDYVSIPWLHVGATAYNFYIDLSLCFNGGKYEDKTYYCVYVETRLYLGDLENHVLKKVTGELKPLIDAALEVEQYIKAHAANEALELAKNGLKLYTLRQDFYR